MAQLFRNPITFEKIKKPDETMRIAVLSATRGAGGSFVCHQKAQKNKTDTFVVELGEANDFFAFGMEKRFAGKKIHYSDDGLSGSASKDEFNEMFGINWLVRNPMTVNSLTQEDIYKLVLFAPKGAVYYDFSGVDENICISLLSEMNQAFLVIDPLPSKLLKAASFIEKVKLVYPNCVFVINKMNKGVHKAELTRFLGGGKIEEYPAKALDKLYAAEYNCVLP